MTLSAITTLGVGLSMDAFAVSLGQGTAASDQQRVSRALLLAVLFGMVQGLMPLLGWSLGAAFYNTFHHIDHWIAFVLLAVLGVMMIRASLGEDNQIPALANGWKLAILAIATSIDAAAAGITLTMLGIPIAISCAIIGVITFSLTLAGALLGRTIGLRMGKTAEIAGGGILIALGVKTLIEHLFFAVS